MQAIANNVIMPYKVNMNHYMAYQNNSDSLQRSLSVGSKYMKDNFGLTPLEYSMNRKSFECTQMVLEYIMETEDIYRTLDCEELTKLIESSPANLQDFFNDSLRIQDKDVPSFG